MPIASRSSKTRGLAHRPSVLAQPQLDNLCSVINSVYDKIESPDPAQRCAIVSQIRARGEKFVPTASSFTVQAALSSAKIEELLKSVCKSAGEWITTHVGCELVIDLDQSWVRRQYAPGRYPPLHAPHAWHQDGALGFDFASGSAQLANSGALLQMITIWIALGLCGIDAPGLEFVRCSDNGLLVPEQLGDSMVRSAFSPGLFWTPVLSAGDALLFSGDILHRTHVLPGMSRDRTSIELRCFPGDKLPGRLKGDRFQLIPL